jgi:P27 family predicted phage terminase small subunit
MESEGKSMGRRGPAPRPAKLKLVEGRSEGRDSGGRRVPLPPKFVRGTPEAPDYLGRWAREEWDRAVDDLERLDLLKRADTGSLIIMCQAFERWLTAQAQYRREGLVLLNPESGRAHKHPAVSVAEAAAREYLLFAREFGLTASAEQRLADAVAVGIDDVVGGYNPFA